MRHIPVLLGESIEALQLTPGAEVIDCTLGDAGHAEAILKATAPDGKLLGIDADIEAVLRAKHYLYQYADRITLVRENFAHLAEVAAREQFPAVDAILMDLGWSTPQFEERGKGFSFMKRNEPLDMRFGAGATQTAAQLLEELPVDAIEKILEEYAEERYAREIAQAIVEVRKDRPIRTVGHLVDLIFDVYRKELRSTADIPWIGGLHPATRTFQALRIAVNDELGVMKKAVPQALALLSSGGRLAVITFHSLEDRIVKHLFRAYHEEGRATLIHKKPIVPSPEEQEQNTSARSAKLRVIQKV